MGRLTEVVDELDWCFGWVGPEHPRLHMTSHAVAADGRVWLLDPVEADVEDRIRALGEPAGVVQLLDRHNRACASWAERLDVPHHRVPFEGVPGAPFEATEVVRRKRWQEIALWWPDRRVLAVGDALGTVPHAFALGSERIGVHPFLRPVPPRNLAAYEPEHVLCGHGEGVHEDATAAVRDAIDGARRRLPRLVLELPAAARSR